MPFFEYHQNNSGGSFVFDAKRGIGVLVIIEADDWMEADSKAESIGLYFGGYGDCSCCGDRWYSMEGASGDDVPSYYGEPIANGVVGGGADWPKGKNAAYGYIHYANGTINPVHHRKGL